MTSTGVAYESPWVRVTHDLRPSDTVLVCFSFYDAGNPSSRPFGEGLARSLDVSGVFVCAAFHNWWQIEDREPLSAAVRDLCAPFAKRIAFGSSMGGYGALSFAASMGCTRAVAFSPQAVVSNLSVEVHPFWLDMVRNTRILHDDVPADLGDLVPEVVYDPYSPADAAQMAYLRERHPMRELRLPFAGHKLLGTLKQSRIFKRMVHHIVRQGLDEAQLKALYSANRKRSTLYLSNLAVTCAVHGHVEVARNIADRVRQTGDPAMIDFVTRRLAFVLEGDVVTHEREGDEIRMAGRRFRLPPSTGLSHAAGA